MALPPWPECIIIQGRLGALSSESNGPNLPLHNLHTETLAWLVCHNIPDHHEDMNNAIYCVNLNLQNRCIKIMNTNGRCTVALTGLSKWPHTNTSLINWPKPRLATFLLHVLCHWWTSPAVSMAPAQKDPPRILHQFRRLFLPSPSL